MPWLAKLFNSILYNRFQNYSDTNKIINPCQIVFQPNARTLDHMLILRTLIEKYVCISQNCLHVLLTVYHCLSFYFEKAFDSVLHSALLLKLAKFDIEGPFYDIIRSTYRGNDLHVRIHDTLMGKFAPKLGVRQGDNLSPNRFKTLLTICHTFSMKEMIKLS